MAQGKNLAFLLYRARQRELAKQVPAEFAAWKSLYRGDRSNFRRHQVDKAIDGMGVVARRFAFHHSTDQRDDAGQLILNVSKDSIHGDMIAGLDRTCAGGEIL
jgi:hypothetical protein